MPRLSDPPVCATRPPRPGAHLVEGRATPHNEARPHIGSYFASLKSQRMDTRVLADTGLPSTVGGSHRQWLFTKSQPAWSRRSELLLATTVQPATLPRGAMPPPSVSCLAHSSVPRWKDRAGMCVYIGISCGKTRTGAKRTSKQVVEVPELPRDRVLSRD